MLQTPRYGFVRIQFTLAAKVHVVARRFPRPLEVLHDVIAFAGVDGAHVAFELGETSQIFLAEILTDLIAIDAQNGGPAKTFGGATAQFKEFRLRGTVLQVDDRARNRVSLELFAEGGVFGRDPVVDHDRAGIDFLQALDHRTPIVDGVLNVGVLASSKSDFASDSRAAFKMVWL